MLERAVEQAISNAAHLHNRVVQSNLARRFNDLREGLPRLPERTLDTPFGRIKTPDYGLPELAPIELDARRLEAYKATLAMDLSAIVAIVPVVGDYIADVIEDTYGEKLSETLSQDELLRFRKHDKAGLSTLALTRTFSRT